MNLSFFAYREERRCFASEKRGKVIGKSAPALPGEKVNGKCNRKRVVRIAEQGARCRDKVIWTEEQGQRAARKGAGKEQARKGEQEQGQGQRTARKGAGREQTRKEETRGQEQGQRAARKGRGETVWKKQKKKAEKQIKTAENQL